MSTTPISLVPGTYTLSVIGYTDVGGLVPVAEGSEPGIVITEGVTTTTPQVVLTAYDPAASLAGENGTFSWNITFTDIADVTDTAKMTITPGSTQVDYLSNATTAPYGYNNTYSELTNTGTATGNISLQAGYYTVQFELDTADGGFIDFTQALWVYQNLTSNFTFNFTAASFGPQEVTFIFNDGSAATPNRLAYTALGGTVAVPTDYTIGDAHPDDPTLELIGWFIDGNTSTPFIGGTTQVLGDMTVEAVWDVPNGEYNAGGITLNPINGIPLELVYNLDAAGATALTGGTVNIANTVTTSAVITVDNYLDASSDPNYSTVGWYYRGAPIGTGPSLNVITGGTLQGSFMRGFTYLIEVRATEDASGLDQSFWFNLVLAP